MLFRDLKSGYPIYIINRVDVTITQGKVTNIGFPHFDANYNNGSDMVVDFAIDWNGQSKTFTMKDSLEVGYSDNGDIIVTPNRESVIREIEAMKTQSEEALSMVDTHKSRVEKCSVLLSEFDPVFRDKKENETRFNNLENSMGKLEQMMATLLSELKSKNNG